VAWKDRYSQASVEREEEEVFDDRNEGIRNRQNAEGAVDKLREAVRLQEEERAVRSQEVRLREVREQEWEMQSGIAIAMAIAVIVASS
jgi:hypothetical protein